MPKVNTTDPRMRAIVRVIKISSNVEPKVREVSAVIIGPFAIHRSLNNYYNEKSMSHVRTGIRLPVLISKESDGYKLARKLLSDNPDLCWNWGEFGKSPTASDLPEGKTIKDYQVAFQVARDALGLKNYR